MTRNLSSLFIAFAIFFSVLSQKSIVTVSEINDQWELLVDGKPFYVKGAGGETQMNKVIECGGNTIRTWGLENAQEVLDEAQAKGLKVMLGMWVQHERHGFDYNDEEKIKNQLNKQGRVVFVFLN